MNVATIRDAVQQAGGTEPERARRPELALMGVDVDACWRLRRRMAVLQSMLGGGLVIVFMYFRVRLQYLRAHRELKRALRNRRKQRVLDMLGQAEEAARRNDARKLYGFVRLLAPHKSTQRIRLRDDKGNLMNGESECRELAKYATELFKAPAALKRRRSPNWSYSRSR